jgi:hypothetical protein
MRPLVVGSVATAVSEVLDDPERPIAKMTFTGYPEDFDIEKTSGVELKRKSLDRKINSVEALNLLRPVRCLLLVLEILLDLGP